MFRELTAVIKIPTNKGSSRLRIVALNIRHFKNIGYVIVRVSTWFSFYFSSIRAVISWGVAQLWSRACAQVCPQYCKDIGCRT